jgi:hypothetical protein
MWSRVGEQLEEIARGGAPKMTSTTFRPHVVIDALEKHGVEYIIVGGLAGVLLGSDSITHDLDICYRRVPANYVALAAALKEIGAQLRGAPEGLPFILDDLTIRNGDCFTFATTGGPFDCLGTPAGTRGYDDLYRASWIANLDGRTVRVCSLDDLIRMKQAASRVKDRVQLEQLYALKKLIESGDGNS